MSAECPVEFRAMVKKCCDFKPLLVRLFIILYIFGLNWSFHCASLQAHGAEKSSLTNLSYVGSSNHLCPVDFHFRLYGLMSTVCVRCVGSGAGGPFDDAGGGSV